MSTNSGGLSVLYLKWGLNIDSNDQSLVSSSGDGQIVLVSHGV